jgi:hypothetical protein
MAELAAVRAEVEATVAADAARATAAELEALRANSINNSVSADDDRDNEFKLAREAAELEALRASSINMSVSADDDRDNELKLAREAAREQAAQWATAHPQGRRGSSPDGCGRSGWGHARRPSPRRQRQPRQARTRRWLG